MVGFNWLLPQCFDLSCFLSKQFVGMHVNMFRVNNLMRGECPLVIAWGITTIYTQFSTLICPRTGVETILISSLVMINIMIGSAKTFHVCVQILTYLIKFQNYITLKQSGVALHYQHRNSLALFQFKEIKNWLNY